MRKLSVGPSGLEISALGFGCVKLTAQRNRREALAVLEHALAQGITHFDVARAYGFGRAEGILGEFLRGKRAQVTVATKLGLQPPKGLGGKAWVVNAAKKILSPFPGLLERAKKTGSSMVKSGVFEPSAAIQSLEISLREMKTDYVDILFLHEAHLDDARNPELIEALQRQVDRGTVRGLGIASDFSKLPADADLLPSAYSLVQFNDNPVARNVPRLLHREKRGIITHSIFQPAAALQEAILRRPEVAREYSSRMNLDLTQPAIMTSLLLHYALASNRAGGVLFASTSPTHITTNARSAETEPYSPAQLAELVKFAGEILAIAPPAAEAHQAAS